MLMSTYIAHNLLIPELHAPKMKLLHQKFLSQLLKLQLGLTLNQECFEIDMHSIVYDTEKCMC